MTPADSRARTMAVLLADFGLQPSEFRDLTVRELHAILNIHAEYSRRR